jgi:UPF0176 protein
VSCPYCVDEAGKHSAAAERQKQMDLGRARGIAHLGDAAATVAAERKAAKRALAEASRAKNRAD